ncbi:MAG: polysaccharide pyruvyl transferase family protein [Candidatus Paceibacterota bacterium]|jgi:colanic acid/amylovoran biosynthesis protein
MQKDIENILITNVYSWKNKGDAAIVLCLLDDLRSQFPRAKIVIYSSDPSDIGKYGDYLVENSLDSIIVSKVLKHRIFKKIVISFFLIRLYLFRLFKKIFNTEAYFLFSDLISERILSYKKYDLVIACGGGYLLTRNVTDIFNLLFMVSGCSIADIFSKPYILYHQSVGPFSSKWHINILRSYLLGAKVVICREQISYDRLIKAGITNAIIKSDIAFLLKTADVEDLVNKYKIDPTKNNIGITVRRWMSKKKHQDYLKAVVDFVNYLIEDENNRIFFMPQVVYVERGDSDHQILEGLFDSDKYKDRVFIVREDLSPQQLKGLIGKMKLFFGTRMHSNIFALSQSIKTIAIAYETKTRGIMDSLRLSKYVINIEDVSKDKLIDLFLGIKNDKDYDAILNRNLDILKDNVFVDLKSFL